MPNPQLIDRLEEMADELSAYKAQIAAATAAGLTTKATQLGTYRSARVATLMAQFPISVARIHNVLAYGGLGDGSTDETLAFQAAVAACESYGTVYIPYGLTGVYKIASGFTISKIINFVMEPGVYISFTGTGTCLRFSASLQRVLHVIDVRRNAVDWTTSNSEGVEYNDCIDSDLHLGAQNFRMGVYFRNTGGQIAENRIYPRQLFENQIGLYFHSDGGSVNANAIYGGRWSNSAAVQPTLDRWGVYCNSAGTCQFYGGTLEIADGASGGVGRTFAFVNTSKWNQVHGAYVEGATSYLYASNDSRHNILRLHASGATGVSVLTKIDDQSNFPGTNVIDWTTGTNIGHSSLGVQNVFECANVARRVLANTDSGASVMRYLVSGFSWRTSAGTTLQQRAEGADLYLADGYLSISSSNALSRKVDTSIVKDFWVSVSKATTDGLKVIVVCFDAAGAVLSGGTHCQGGSQDVNSWNTFAQDANWGGSYSCSPCTETTFFRVAATVKSVLVCVTTTATSIGIAGLSIKCAGNQAVPDSSPGLDFMASSLAQYNEMDARDLSCENIPLGGILNKGQRVWDLDTAAAAAPGWVCSRAVQTTTTAGVAAAGTVLPVTAITISTSTITIGDIVGVIINNGAGISKWFWTDVTNVAALNVTIGDAIPAGWAVASGAKVRTYLLKAMAAIAA